MPKPKRTTSKKGDDATPVAKRARSQRRRADPSPVSNKKPRLTSASETPSSSQATTLIPPHSMKVRFKLKRLDVRVDLIRIPDKYISLDVNESTLHLDTFQYNKKFELNLTYPQGIKVDTAKVSATLDKPGILRVELPVTEMLDLETGKLLRKKSSSSSNRKKAAVSAKPKSSKKSNGEKPASAPREKQKGHRSAEDIQTEKNKMMEKIESFNKEQDDKRASKLLKEKERTEYMNAKEEAKLSKKKKSEELREKSLQSTSAAEKKKTTRSKSKSGTAASKPVATRRSPRTKKNVSFDNVVKVKKIKK
eukprot:TRINITY_DN5598_c0_g1_i1.p1 TRINITY_DN5598_c0_g1~~TRINITY_DN5598_c0_g1_i1.p1  ORF type:complete len:320 (+),score=108.03 TRINITY_DN5598_c0_g1_i1:40-960(+)